MQTQKHYYGKTYITHTYPWGLYPRNGHRLLCADGKIRAAELAETADTFFSVPASVRINGKRISGYMTVETATGLSSDNESLRCYVFRSHDCHYDKIKCFPDGGELETMIRSAQ